MAQSGKNVQRRLAQFHQRLQQILRNASYLSLFAYFLEHQFAMSLFSMLRYVDPDHPFQGSYLFTLSNSPCTLFTTMTCWEASIVQLSLCAVQKFAKHWHWRQEARDSCPCPSFLRTCCLVESQVIDNAASSRWTIRTGKVRQKRVKSSSSWVKQYCILKIYYAFEQHGHCEGCKSVITINSRLHSVLIMYVNCEQLCQ